MPANQTADERFEALWAAHYADVFAYALRRLGDQAGASDVAAETFLIAWRKLDVTTDPTRAWLLGVARKVLSNHVRGEHRRHALWAKIANSRDDPPQDPNDGPAGAVAAAFNLLSPSDREVLSLVAWEDLKPREAAAVLGINAATFSVRLHRARSRLRKKVKVAGHTGVEGPADDAQSSRRKLTQLRSER